jgi:hypothetical protein
MPKTLCGKLAAVFAAVMWVCCTPVHARVGETPQECQARYGKEIGTKGEWHGFKKGAIYVAVTFYNGHADAIMFSHNWFANAGEVKLSQSEIDTLLASNAGGRKWKSAGTDLWKTDDGALQASTLDDRGELVITTVARLNRHGSKNSSHGSSTLKGF